ncbi:hypothetical protein ACIPUC_14010 [Streptomyces sp. LARHCF249]
MITSDGLLHRIGNDPDIAALLAWPGGFSLGGEEHGEDFQLPGGLPRYPIASCGSGGVYFLCGEPGAAQRPVLYVGSEGEATLMGADLAEAVALITACPYWQDLGNGHPVDDLEEALREDHPGIDERRDRAFAVLGLARPTAGEALTRLRAVAARTAPHYLPTSPAEDDDEEDMPYDLLFRNDA